ncbi:MAG: asparagine synthase-related protein [bacterium]
MSEFLLLATHNESGFSRSERTMVHATAGVLTLTAPAVRADNDSGPSFWVSSAQAPRLLVSASGVTTGLVLGTPYGIGASCAELAVNDWPAMEARELYRRLGGAYTAVLATQTHGQVKVLSDLFGQQPLFLFEAPGMVALGSSIRILLDNLPQIPRALDLGQLSEFIVTGVNGRTKSFFSHIVRVPGNSALIIDCERMTLQRSEGADFRAYLETASELTPLHMREDLARVLEDCTREQRCAYSLSGGVDSSLLLAVAAQKKDSGKPDCFTAGTPYGLDALFAVKAARYCQAALHQVDMAADSPSIDVAASLTRLHGGPVHITGSSVGYAFLCRQARQSGFAGVINGHGEDFATVSGHASICRVAIPWSKDKVN